MSTPQSRIKMTIVPLRSAEDNLLADNESVSLGFGMSVERCKKLLGDSNLWIWHHKASPFDKEEMDDWDICLVHRYQWHPVTGEPDEASAKLVAYVLAHLRLINPHRDSVDDYIQLEETTTGGYNAFRCNKAAFRPNRFLSDCENLCWGINRTHLDELKSFMPWIVNFASNWELCYPLWISLFFIEQGYLSGQNFRTIHLFRVMALEGLFCSETSFGKKALTGRIPKLLGAGIDLYEAYSVDYFPLPQLELTVDLIKDIYTLRNKIAHSDVFPDAWRKRVVRHGLMNEAITYGDQLLEAATSICRLAWLKIIKDGLQSTFSDKVKMQAYLR